MDANHRHCGWSNYQTWAVNLYLGDYFTERTAEYIAQGGKVSAIDVADSLRSDFNQIIYDRYPAHGKREEIDYLVADLLSSARREIEWRELAEAYLDNIGATY